MLSSDASRFYWAKRDRQPDPTFFRMMSSQWRRPERREIDGDEHQWRKFRGGRSRPAGKAAKVTWSPWLWVR